MDNTYIIYVRGQQMMVNKEEQPCTCCFDVIRLMEVTSVIPNYLRGFSLYKTKVYDGKDTWKYYLLLEDDTFPVVITKEFADTILEHPEEGEYVAWNMWFDRYR